MSGLFLYEQRNLALRSFVTTQVLLRFGKHNVLTKLRAVLLQAQLFWGVHCVLSSVVNALAALFTNHTNNLAFVAFFSHI